MSGLPPRPPLFPYTTLFRSLFDNLGLDSQYEDWFRHRAWVRTVHGTTRIEGNSLSDLEVAQDRKSTRLNSSHQIISYAVVCLKKKRDNEPAHLPRQRLPVDV